MEPIVVPEKPKARKSETTRRRPPPQPVHHDAGPSLWVLAFVALVGIVMIGGFFGTIGYFTRTPGEVTVPDLVGKTQQEATALLARYHLTPEIQSDYNEHVKEGVVYRSQPPKNTTIKVGKAVQVFVSKGNQPINVPDVVGKNLSSAQKELKAAGLALGPSTEEFSEIVDKGKVISQSPTGGGEARKTTPVSLVLSKGPEPVPAVPVEPAPSDKAADSGAGDKTANGDQAASPAPDQFPAASLEPRELEVKVDIPSTNTGTQHVRIVVRNEDKTEQTAYDEDHQPGDHLKQPVTAYGAKGKCEIRVYLNGKLVHHETA